MKTITVNLYPRLFPGLNIAEVDVVEGAAGPGRRLVIWLQGCLKRCYNCANDLFLSTKISHILNVEQLLYILDNTQDLSGITLSGGEPILQAAGLIPFLEGVHSRGLTTVCYSGYTLEELMMNGNDSALAKFLDQIDLLIDGEYRQYLPRVGIYRPSSNQRLHFLTECISPESCENNPETVFAITGGHATTTGTLPMFITRKIFEKLRDQGITLVNPSPQ